MNYILISSFSQLAIKKNQEQLIFFSNETVFDKVNLPFNVSIAFHQIVPLSSEAYLNNA